MTDANDQWDDSQDLDAYALKVASDSYGWYSKAAIRSRRLYKIVESAIILVGASIPVSALVEPGNSVVPGALGAAVVVISGLRGVFHWQDNYLRFSSAREAAEAERRGYRTRADPYGDDRTRAQLLVASITRVEQTEMRTWVKLVSQRRQQVPGGQTTA